MIAVNKEKCVGCKACEQVCPVEAIKVVDRKAQLVGDCVNCLSCIKYCKPGALSEIPQEGEYLLCKNCGVRCLIPQGKVGACKRFSNIGGELVLNRPLQVPPIRTTSLPPTSSTRSGGNSTSSPS